MTLETLPDREYRSGLAEIVKYGAVCDKAFFEYLANNSARLLSREKNVLVESIKKSCLMKASVVERDEREGGYRAVLNFGHTYAHAVECLTGYTSFLHGEAVSIGMVQAAKLSEMRGYASRKDTENIIALLSVLGLPVSLPPFAADKYRDVMRKDKKSRVDGIHFVFNKGIGDSVIERVNDWNFLVSLIPHEV
jgi:3-dehydroquinate synthase